MSGILDYAKPPGDKTAAPPPKPPAAPKPSGGILRFAGSAPASAPPPAPAETARPDAAGLAISRKIGAAAAGPLGVLDAALGAPERAVEGAVGSKGNPLQRAGHAAYEVFHPNDTPTRAANLENAQKNLGMGGRDAGTGAVANAHNFVRDTATQTVLDPLTYLPFIGEGRLLERGVVGGARALHDALPPAARGVLQKTGDFFRANPEMDRALGGKGATIYHGIYRSERGKLGQQTTADANMLLRNKKAIDAGEVPNEVRSRLLQGVYDNGTEDMRAKAVSIAHEQGVPIVEHGRPPTNILSHNVRDDYDELMKKETRRQAQAPGETQAKPFARVIDKPTVAGFEKARTDEGVENAETLYDRLSRRLGNERNVVFERNVDQRILHELVMANKNGPEARELLADPEAFNKLRAAGVTQGVKYEKLKWLQRLSDAYKTALFINPLPHMFNIARLTYLAGGFPAVARGISHFFKGGPTGELRQRIEEHVGLPEYLTGQAPQFADRLPGVRALRQFGQSKLSSFDASMRAGYLQELDDALGKGADHSLGEYEKGKQVSEGIGSYDEHAPLVEAIRAAGGPFAAWRLSVVPRAVGSAVLRHPERVERYARGMNTLNQDTGANVQFGGPIEDMARLVNGPQSAARYLTSPSTLGPIPASIVSAAGNNRKFDATQEAEELARNYIPGAGIAEEAAHLSPFPEGPNVAANVGLGLVGGYTTSAPTKSQKAQRNAITRYYDTLIRGNLAKGDYRSAWDAYLHKTQRLRGMP